MERERSGVGQRVEVAMLDAVVSLFADVAANVLTAGEKYGKFGSGHPDLVPYQAFPARDGYFIVACLTNAFFKRPCAAIEREDLLADPRFATNDLRVKHRDAIVPILSEVFRTRECEHWIALLVAQDIPACRVNMLDGILAHPQIAENGTSPSARAGGEAGCGHSRRRSSSRRRPAWSVSRPCSASTPTSAARARRERGRDRGAAGSRSGLRWPTQLHFSTSSTAIG